VPSANKPSTKSSPIFIFIAYSSQPISISFSWRFITCLRCIYDSSCMRWRQYIWLLWFLYHQTSTILLEELCCDEVHNTELKFHCDRRDSALDSS